MNVEDRKSDFAYLDQVKKTTELLEKLGADFDPIEEPDDPAWREISSWQEQQAVESLLGAAWSNELLLASAVNVLGWRRDQTAVLPLADILDNLDEKNFEDHLDWLFTVATLVEALGRIGDERAISALNGVLSHLTAIPQSELDKKVPGPLLVDLVTLGLPQDDNELLYFSLFDAYEELGKHSVVPLTAMLALPYGHLIDQILVLLERWDLIPNGEILAVLVQKGNQNATKLLKKMKKVAEG